MRDALPFILVLVLMYVIGSFVAFSLNPGDWSQGLRAGMVAIAMVAELLTLLICDGERRS